MECRIELPGKELYTMPAILNWFLRLLPTNPICVRVVKGGSLRMRQLVIRGGFLGALILLMLMLLLVNFTASTTSLRSLATTGAMIFAFVSIIQVMLVCLLTPVFMSGAIAHESNPRTWEILLSTPLNSLQIVLGNLFGRLFFILALLVSSLPLFMVLQFFGGVPDGSILGSFLIASSSALLVASIAVTLSVTRAGGRRAVFLFSAGVVLYLFGTYALDMVMRTPIPGGDGAKWTTVMTPLNPFLALEVLLASNSYVPRSSEEFGWLTKLWLARPIDTFCWLCLLSSVGLIAFSTTCVRLFSRNGQMDSVLRTVIGRTRQTSLERDPRPVGENAVAWRESHRDAGNLAGMIGRWSFVAVGLAATITMLWLHNGGQFDLGTLRTGIGFLVFAEVCIVILTAVNLSATAVSREREDGTLDIILTTPIQPGPYLAGKHMGLVRYLLPMMLAPIGSLLLTMLYVLMDGLGSTIDQAFTTVSGDSAEAPFILWQGVVAFTMMFIPFIAFCVMIGLMWSIRSRGTIGSVVAAVIIVGGLTALLSSCSMIIFNSTQVLGLVTVSISPVNLLLFSLDPLPWASRLDPASNLGTWLVLGGGLVSGVGWGVLALLLHRNMSRTFMMTVRQLAGR